MKPTFEPAASAEFLRAIQRYAVEAGATVASDFKDEVMSKLAMLADSPELGFTTSQGIRRFPLRRFPFTIVYRHAADSLCVIAIAHQSRMPEYWRHRR